MSGVEFDVSQVRKLAADIGKSADPVRVSVEARKVIQKGSLNIKNELRAQASASVAEARALSGFITYDTKQTSTGVSGEIGPTEGASGSFAFLYFGNSKNGPLLPDPGDALNKEAPNVEKYLGAILGDVL